MRNHRQETLESNRPDKDAVTCIGHCLSSLYADNNHGIEEEVVNNLTYEELIGTLLESKDEISRLEDALEASQDYWG